MTLEQLYAIATQLLNRMEQQEPLTDEQHTLLAFCYLDSQVQEGGFVQLIASGYGEYVFINPLADSLRRWQIKQIPKVLDRAKALYLKQGEKIEACADEDLDVLRARFADFEELDADYYEVCEEDLEKICMYVTTHYALFL